MFLLFTQKHDTSYMKKYDLTQGDPEKVGIIPFVAIFKIE